MLFRSKRHWIEPTAASAEANVQSEPTGAAELNLGVENGLEGLSDLSDEAVEQILARQLELMRQQIEILKKRAGTAAYPAANSSEHFGLSSASNAALGHTTAASTEGSEPLLPSAIGVREPPKKA